MRYTGLCEPQCDYSNPLPLKTPSDQPVPFTYKQDSPMAHASYQHCGWDWNSSSLITSPVVPDDISGSGVTSPIALASTRSSTSEPPNSSMTASCILWLAARKLPMEMVGKPCEVLVLGCVFLLCRSRWKRQITIVERLHGFSQTSASPDIDSPVLNRC